MVYTIQKARLNCGGRLSNSLEKCASSSPSRQSMPVMVLPVFNDGLALHEIKVYQTEILYYYTEGDSLN